MSEQKSNTSLEQEKERYIQMGYEALCNIFHRFAFNGEVSFSDGRTGRIKPFFAPIITERNDHLNGIPHCGIHIRFFDDTSPLEIILYLGDRGMPMSSEKSDKQKLP